MAGQSDYIADGQLFEASGMITSQSPAALGCSCNSQELIEYEATSMNRGEKRKGRKIGMQLDAWLNEGTKEGAWNALANARFEKTSDPSNEIESVYDDILIEFEDLMDG